MTKKYNWLVAACMATIIPIGMADLNTPIATPNNANSTPDPCLNNPNIYVKQSCEQVQQGSAKRATAMQQQQTTQSNTPQQMPAWQQALQHNSPANTNANAVGNATPGASSPPAKNNP